jgi:hypothetical protein
MSVPAGPEVRLLKALAIADEFARCMPTYSERHVLEVAARSNQVNPGELAALFFCRAVARERARLWLRAVEAADAAVTNAPDSLRSLGRRPLVVSRPRKRA